MTDDSFNPQAIARDGERTQVRLTDARQMRAVAHPKRLALIGLLRREGPLTATEAGARLGESSGSMSFHLRQLAKYGLVEETGEGTGRQKPWRATARFTSWSAAPEDPDLAEATTQFSRVIAARYAAMTDAWVDQQAEESGRLEDRRAVRRHLPVADPGGAHPPRRAGGRAARALRRPADGRDQRPEGSRLVSWLNLAFPVRTP